MTTPAPVLPSPRALGLFVLVAEELHFSRAARRAGIAQPALSHQIRRLEEDLGFQLFERTNRRVLLTSTGEAFLRTARHVLATLRDGVEAGRLVGAGALGRVVVGYSASAMLTVLPGIIRRLRANHPGVQVVLREMSSAPQLEGLAAGALDAAFSVAGAHHLPPMRSDKNGTGAFERVAHWPDRVVLALPAGHALTGRRSVSSTPRAPFHPSPLVLFPREQAPTLFDATLALSARLGLATEVSQYAQSWPMVLALVATGLGVSVVPGAVQRLRVAGVRFVDIKPAPFDTGVAMCVRSGEETSVVGALRAAASTVRL